MSLPTISNVFRCALNWTGNSPHHATNVIHVRTATFTEDELIDTLLANFTDAMWNTVADSFRITNITITKLDGTPDSVSRDLVNTTPRVSGSGGSQFIPQASAIMKLSTGGGGRSGRGRIFLPALAEGVQDGGLIDSTKVVAATSAWSVFEDNLELAPADLGVASYKLAAFRNITSVVMEPRSGTQRKRNPR